MKIKLIIIFILTFSNYISQNKEIDLTLNKNSFFSYFLNLKGHGFILVSHNTNGGVTNELNYYDDNLNYKWSKELKNEYVIELVTSPKGFPIHTCYPNPNNSLTLLTIDSLGSFSEKEIKINSKIEIRERLVSLDNGYKLITKYKKRKEKNKDTYIVRDLDLDLKILNTKEYSFRKYPQKNSYWKKASFLDYGIYYFQNKYNNKNDQRINVDYIYIRDGIVIDKKIESSHSSIYKSNRLIEYIFDYKSGNSFLGYLSNNSDSIIVDCFDLEGKIKWTWKYNYIKGSNDTSSENLSLDKSFKSEINLYNFLSLVSVDNNTLGIELSTDYMSNSNNSYNFFISKKSGALIDKNNLKLKHEYVYQKAIINNFIITQNDGKIGEHIESRAKEFNKKSELRNAKYSYLSKKDYYILVIFSGTQLNVSKF